MINKSDRGKDVNITKNFLSVLLMLCFCVWGASSYAIDTDSDGIPDAWEDAHGLNKNSQVDASSDADTDGLSAVDEYRSGTNSVGTNDYTLAIFGDTQFDVRLKQRIDEIKEVAESAELCGVGKSCDDLCLEYVNDESYEEYKYNVYLKTSSHVCPDGSSLFVIPDVLDKQIDWLATNVNELNLKSVLHMGDIAYVDTADDGGAAQWGIVDAAYMQLDTENIPYSVIPGNHDYDFKDNKRRAQKDSEGFNNIFNATRFNGKSWYGKHAGDLGYGVSTDPLTANDNNFITFDVDTGGDSVDKFLVLGLENAPRKDALCWANHVAENNQDRLILATTHSGWEGFPRKFFADHHNNIILAMNGHIFESDHYETSREWGGGSYHRLVTDYAGESHLGFVLDSAGTIWADTFGSSGWFRMLTFRPDAGKITADIRTPLADDVASRDIYFPEWYIEAGGTGYETHGAGYAKGEPRISTSGDYLNQFPHFLSDLDYDKDWDDAGGDYLNTKLNGSYPYVGFPDSYVNSIVYQDVDDNDNHQPIIVGSTNGGMKVFWYNDVGSVYERSYRKDGCDGTLMTDWWSGTYSSNGSQSPLVTSQSGLSNLTAATSDDASQTIIAWEVGGDVKYSLDLGSTIETPISGASNPSVAIDNNGKYVIAYEKAGNIEVKTNTTTITNFGSGENPAIAMNAAASTHGDYVIAWQVVAGNGDYDIMSRFVIGGTATNRTITITNGDETNPAVSMNTASHYVIAWEDHVVDQVNIDLAAEWNSVYTDWEIEETFEPDDNGYGPEYTKFVDPAVAINTDKELSLVYQYMGNSVCGGTSDCKYGDVVIARTYLEHPISGAFDWFEYQASSTVTKDHDFDDDTDGPGTVYTHQNSMPTVFLRDNGDQIVTWRSGIYKLLPYSGAQATETDHYQILMSGIKANDLFDSDSDGLLDTAEDINQDGYLDAGETDPYDSDTDDDGVLDSVERIAGTDPTDMDGDTDNDGLSDYLELSHEVSKVEQHCIYGIDGNQCTDPLLPDTDGDGVSDKDEIDAGPGPIVNNPLLDNSADLDGDSIPDDIDIDIDGDGVFDYYDAFPYVATEWHDVDGDGIGNNSDADIDGDMVLNGSDEDVDGDGICEAGTITGSCTGHSDNCPVDYNPVVDHDSNTATPEIQPDMDNDNIGDACDLDRDNDGINNGLDPFPENSAWKTDHDRDGVDDVAGPDNCLGLANSLQANFDGDSLGDLCDTDDDNDGVLDTSDVFPFDGAEWADADADGIGDVADQCDATVSLDSDNDGDGCDDVAEDLDDDNDGVADVSDAFPLDGAESADVDADGVGDNADQCDATVSLDSDNDGDGCDDIAEDLDDDNDGCADVADPYPLIARLGCSSFDLANINFTFTLESSFEAGMDAVILPVEGDYPPVPTELVPDIEEELLTHSNMINIWFPESVDYNLNGAPWAALDVTGGSGNDGDGQYEDEVYSAAYRDAVLTKLEEDYPYFYSRLQEVHRRTVIENTGNTKKVFLQGHFVNTPWAELGNYGDEAPNGIYYPEGFLDEGFVVAGCDPACGEGANGYPTWEDPDTRRAMALLMRFLVDYLEVDYLAVARETDQLVTIKNDYGYFRNRYPDFRNDIEDTDTDGLPDKWEQFYFADLDEVGSGDPDNDGLNHVEELIAGKDPSVAGGEGIDAHSKFHGSYVAMYDGVIQELDKEVAPPTVFVTKDFHWPGTSKADFLSFAYLHIGTEVPFAMAFSNYPGKVDSWVYDFNGNEEKSKRLIDDGCASSGKAQLTINEAVQRQICQLQAWVDDLYVPSDIRIWSDATYNAGGSTDDAGTKISNFEITQYNEDAVLPNYKIVFSESNFPGWNEFDVLPFEQDDFDFGQDVRYEYYKVAMNQPFVAPSTALNGYANQPIELDFVQLNGTAEVYSGIAFPGIINANGSGGDDWYSKGHIAATMTAVHNFKVSPIALLLDTYNDPDAIGSGNENDFDNDGIKNLQEANGGYLNNPVDNCPYYYNPGQADTDGDGVGDACDNCVALVNPMQFDIDMDGYGNICDLDFDNDADIDTADKTLLEDCLTASGDGNTPQWDCMEVSGVSVNFNLALDIASATAGATDGVIDSANDLAQFNSSGLCNVDSAACSMGSGNFASGLLCAGMDTNGDGHAGPCPDTRFIPMFNDSDGDGIVNASDTEPLKGDRDNDGFPDGLDPYPNTITPSTYDGDSDGMYDLWEINNGLDIANNDSAADADGDGRTNAQEFADGTHPWRADSDSDNLSDKTEVTNCIYGVGSNECTDPNNANTDGDWALIGVDADCMPVEFSYVSDFDEIAFGFDPVIADTDGDGAIDFAELNQQLEPGAWICGVGSDVDDVDSDGDDYCDGDNVVSTDVGYGTCANASDNCPLDSNASQLDTDSDDIGDACDPDDDNDSLTDVQEGAYGSDPLSHFDPATISTNNGMSVALGLIPTEFSGEAYPNIFAQWAIGSGGALFDYVVNADLKDVNQDINGLSWIDPTGNAQSLFAPVDPVYGGGDAVKVDVLNRTGYGDYLCVIREDTSVWCGSPHAGGSIPDLNVVGISGVTDITLSDGEIDPVDPNIVLSEPFMCGISYGDVLCTGPDGADLPDIGFPNEFDLAGGEAVAIASGAKHFCAIVEGGSAGPIMCWGDDSKAQLYDDDSFASGDPVTPFAISAGDFHTCVIDGTKTPGGATVKCWGDNTHGQTSVPGDLIDANAVRMRSGGNQNCAVLAQSGGLMLNDLVCWPTPIDSDADSLSDREELALGTNPLWPDTDGDGLDDAAEQGLGTNPTLPDTDDDGVVDSLDVNPLTWEEQTGKLDRFSDNRPDNQNAWTVNGYAVDTDIQGLSGGIQLSLPGANPDDGKIIVAGYVNNGTNDDFALARYELDGDLDTTFGTGGVVTINMSTANGANDNDRATAILQQSDGKVVVAGYAYNGTNMDFALARVDEDGVLDSSFGSGGKVLTNISQAAATANRNDYIQAVIQQSDNQLVAVGYSYVSGSNLNDFAIARYDVSDGALDDTGFNASGSLPGTRTIPVTSGAYDDEAYSVIEQSNDKLVLAGKTDNGTDLDIALVRLDDDGTLDSGFDGDSGLGNGIVTVAPLNSQSSNGDDVAYAIVQQASGKLVVAGYYLDGEYCGGSCTDDNHVILMRFDDADGAIDTTFADNGKRTIDTHWQAWDEHIRALTIADNNDLVAVGQTCSNWNGGAKTCNNYDVLTLRLDQNGNQDASFNQTYTEPFATGVQVTDAGGTVDQANAVVIQDDDFILTIGTSGSTVDGDAATVRYFP